MNIPITASRLLDRAILLEEGGAIVVPCASYEDMEKLRIRLYKLKRQLEENYRDMALSLDIKRKVSGNRWTIFISKDTALSGVFVVEGGEAKPFELEEVELPDEEEKEEEKETELPELPEVDFDDIAAEIEETQGLIEEAELPKKGEADEKDNTV